MDNAFSHIRHGLSNLEDARTQLIDFGEQCFHSETEAFSRLRQTLYAIRQLPTLPEVPVIDPTIVSQYHTLLSRTELENLSAWEAELLSWYPPVACSIPFLDLLSRGSISLGTRTLMGLLHSYHQTWEPSAAAATIGKLIGELLRASPAKTRYASIWKQRTQYIAWPEDYHLLGTFLWQTQEPVADVCRLFGIYPVSTFVRQSVLSSIKGCESRLDKLNAVEIAYLIEQLLGASSLDEKTVRMAINFLLCCSHIEKNRRLTDSLVRFVLADTNLGNPHIAPAHWCDMQNEARTRFGRLMALSDINFFIENLVEANEERSHRGQLWLSYVGSIRRTRLLIGEQIWSRALNRLSLSDSSGRGLGKLSGATSSALIIDFGEIVVVDFSPSNDSCYLYSRKAFGRILPGFWKDDSSVFALKDEAQALRKIPRILRSWRDTARRALTEYGIRKAR